MNQPNWAIMLEVQAANIKKAKQRQVSEECARKREARRAIEDHNDRKFIESLNELIFD